MSYHVFTTAANHKVAISDKHFLFVDGVEADPATVKLGQSLYREKTGQDKFRPTQARPPPSSHTRTTHTSLSRMLRRRRRRPSTTFSSPARIRTRTTSTRWRARRGAD